MRVAFQGEPGAYSDLAVCRFWEGAAPERVPAPTFSAVFAQVIAGEADHGIVPLENSLTGSYHIHFDLLLASDLSVVGEIVLRIVHHLLALPGTELAELREVWSHPQALEQCSTFLDAHPHLRRIAMSDSGAAARQLRDEGRRDAAVIASSLAGELYGLAPLASEIEDNRENYTRYWLIGRPQPAPAGGPAKTSVVFGIKDAPGTLFKCLSVFALRNIDLLKLESRPIQGKPWQYLFYMDVDGSLADEGVAHACATLQEVTTYFRVLGSYRRGRVVE